MNQEIKWKKKSNHGEGGIGWVLFGARVPHFLKILDWLWLYVNLDKGSQFWFRGSFSDSPGHKLRIE